MSRPVQAPPRPDATADTPARGLGWALLIAGGIGLVAAFVLAVEKYLLLADPSYVPSCSLNAVLSCTSVMESSNAQALGFPNPLLGVVAFTVVLVSGVLLLGGVTLPRWYWTGLHAGATVGVLFVHWLIFVSLYRIGALCPYCMVVWTVTVVIFWSVTRQVLVDAAAEASDRGHRVLTRLTARPALVVAVWLLVIAALVMLRFGF